MKKRNEKEWNKKITIWTGELVEVGEGARPVGVPGGTGSITRFVAVTRLFAASIVEGSNLKVLVLFVAKVASLAWSEEKVVGGWEAWGLSVTDPAGWRWSSLSLLAQKSLACFAEFERVNLKQKIRWKYTKIL